MNRLYVVGIGPGAPEQMTAAASQTLENAEIIVGYRGYLDLVRPLYPGREFLGTGMTQERTRCLLAIERAMAGRRVAMVCSGDAGIYGMAGLLLELSDPNVLQIEVVPGVTAALSGGALLGAPLGHDFAVVSLSDLLTPWELIVRKLECAARGDFAICLYNPGSHKRENYLRRACAVVLQYQRPETVCGVVRNIGREGERWELTTLQELKECQVDMFTTVFIGNSKTKNVGGRMVTPRGYRNE